MVGHPCPNILVFSRGWHCIRTAGLWVVPARCHFLREKLTFMFEKVRASSPSLSPPRVCVTHSVREPWARPGVAQPLSMDLEPGGQGSIPHEPLLGFGLCPQKGDRREVQEAA